MVYLFVNGGTIFLLLKNKGKRIFYLRALLTPNFLGNVENVAPGPT